MNIIPVVLLLARLVGIQGLKRLLFHPSRLLALGRPQDFPREYCIAFEGHARVIDDFARDHHVGFELFVRNHSDLAIRQIAILHGFVVRDDGGMLLLL